MFRNRKGYHSINVQTVSSHDLRVLDIVARYPGSTHDSFIFNNSRLKRRFESGAFQNFILLGDGGYALMTPLRNPQTRGQRLYNESHIKTRNTVERQYGVMKRRFPCLSQGLRLKLTTQANIIVACSKKYTRENTLLFSDSNKRTIQKSKILNHWCWFFNTKRKSTQKRSPTLII